MHGDQRSSKSHRDRQTVSNRGHSHKRRVYSRDRDQDVVKRSRHFFGGGQTVKQYSRAYTPIAFAIYIVYF